MHALRHDRLVPRLLRIRVWLGAPRSVEAEVKGCLTVMQIAELSSRRLRTISVAIVNAPATSMSYPLRHGRADAQR